MDNQLKLQAVIAALTEKGIEHWTNVETPKKHVRIAVYLPKHNIAVFVGHDEEWFREVRFYAFPVFIRDGESTDFVIQKVWNTILNPMGSLQPARCTWFRKHVRAENKYCQARRKRKKVTAVRVNR